VTEHIDLPLDGALAPALLQDMARMLRHLGVQSLRASAVDMNSMAFQAAWSISSDGTVREGVPGRALDSIFPGGSSALGRLERLPADGTLSQKLSPRRWVFAWRLDERNAAVTEAQFQARRDLVADGDVALIRLLCNTSLRGVAGASPALAPGTAAMVWPQHERRALRRPPVSMTWLLSLLLATSVLSSAWHALAALPAARDATLAQRSEIERQNRMAENTMTQDLSNTLAAGDYGEVQDALSLFSSLGYFKGAVVTNTKDRVIAMIGPLDKLHIGDALTQDGLAGSRSFDLRLGSERYGRLLLIPPAAPPAAPSSSSLIASVLAFASSLAAAGLFVTQRRNGRS